MQCRVQDVRATEKDKVKIFTSFRPGDIVRAQVVCLFFVGSQLGLLPAVLMRLTLVTSRFPSAINSTTFYLLRETSSELS